MINSPNVQTHALDCAMNNYLYDMAVKPNIRVYCTCHDEQTDHSNYVIRLWEKILITCLFISLVANGKVFFYLRKIRCQHTYYLNENTIVIKLKNVIWDKCLTFVNIFGYQWHSICRMLYKCTTMTNIQFNLINIITVNPITNCCKWIGV